MGYSKTHSVSINPFTEEKVYEKEYHTKEQINGIIEASLEAYKQRWRNVSFEERAKVLNAVAKEMRDNLDEYALPMTEEMGKPINEARGEVQKAAWCAEHYASHAKEYLKKEYVESDAMVSYVQYPPLGPTLGILPWNAPFWLAFRYLAPALMAGNTCVMKHDSHTPQCSDMIVQAFERVGMPKDIVQNVFMSGADSDYAMKHPIIRAISFTGSDSVGSKIGGIAGSEIKPCVLELGGSDPAIVLADVNDMDVAADTIVLSRYINAGQSCIAAKRIIVEDAIYDTFVAKLKERFAKLKVGDPKDESVAIGPIARKDLVEEMHEQVDKSVAAGAKLVLGGQRHEGKGFFFPVTMLIDVEPGMAVSCQETFGPIATVIRAKDADDAVRIANDTEFGLGAAVWTDPVRGEAMAAQIEAGQVAVNGIVKTDPRLPSGGVKRSGLGRELGSHGIKMFVNTQQVWVGPKRG